MARHLGTAALLVSLLISHVAWADGAGAWRRWPTTLRPNRCLAWDGYQLLNMCYRSPTFVFPAWAHFQR
jgi:hypothetical protein